MTIRSMTTQCMNEVFFCGRSGLEPLRQRKAIPIPFFHMTGSSGSGFSSCFGVHDVLCGKKTILHISSTLIPSLIQKSSHCCYPKPENSRQCFDSHIILPAEPVVVKHFATSDTPKIGSNPIQASDPICYFYRISSDTRIPRRRRTPSGLLFCRSRPCLHHPTSSNCV